MAQAPARKRVARTAVVARKEQLAPSMVRLIFTGDDLAALPDLPYTDHYIKILFAPAGADYRWPFDADQLKETLRAEQWPVTRTYTIRSFDKAAGEMTVDFVVHGDEGLAGPWAANAQAGDQMGFFGPGGAYAPAEDAETHLLVGDESAIPAIAAALDRLADDATAEVFIEVAGREHRQQLRQTGQTRINWIHRNEHGLGYGQALAAAVRASDIPTGRLDGFVHGNADMVKDLRRFLFVEKGIERKQVSISGYWRTGHSEDGWQASKGEFNRRMEEEEAT